jgi:hypothetical protein
VVLDAPFSPYLSDPGFIRASARRFDWPPVDVEVVINVGRVGLEEL